MHPVLLRLGPFTLHTYGVLVAVGVLLAIWLARRNAEARQGARSGAGPDPDQVWNLGVYMVLAGIVGAKIWLVLQFWSYYRNHVGEILSLGTLQSAGVYYGGLIAALIVAIVYARRTRLPFLGLADVYAAPLALGHAVGRLGCFSAGCCWGKPAQVAWSVSFTDPYAADLVGVPLRQPLHPVQIYEAAANLCIFGILLWFDRRPRPAGKIFAAYAMLYGVTRFTTEMFRGDPDRTMLFGGAVSLMQVVSVGLLLIGAWTWWSASGEAGSQDALH